MPPTLLVHGGADEVVPVRESLELRDLLLRHGRSCEVKVYPGAGHVFARRDGGVDWAAALEAQQLALAFLNRHLRQAGPKQEAPSPGPADEDGPAAEGSGRGGPPMGLLLAAGCAIVLVAAPLAAWVRRRGRRAAA
jgi:hypothetical protein